VLYLGEINDQQKESWQKSLDVFDEESERTMKLKLFPEDRPLPNNSVDSIGVKLSEMELERPRQFGNCWLGCYLWEQLQLDKFWSAAMPHVREDVPWTKVLELLVVNRLCDPGSEFRLHRQWFDRSAMDELLGEDFVVAEKDRLYRCLDRALPHKEALCCFLKGRWKDLFNAQFEVLLYDLTSTYIEGTGEQMSKAKRGYSRDGRSDCLQLVIALVITTEGFPIAYEVLAGNTSDRTTLRDFLKKIETLYGKVRRVWVMDRGIPTEEVLEEMRASDPVVSYLVGTPKSKLRALHQQFVDRPWQKVRESVEVKIMAQKEEVWVLAKSDGRKAKEIAIRRRKLVRLLRTLRAIRRTCRTRDILLLKLGAAKQEAGKAYRFVKIRIPSAGQRVRPENFEFALEKQKLREAELIDGHYLLRSNLAAEDPALLWQRYIQLTQIESVFRSLKSDLGIRPIYHQKQERAEAHILVAFLAYALSVTLKKRLEAHAPGLTSHAVLEKFASIQMLDVCLPTTDGRQLVMPRYTKPEKEHLLLLEKLQIQLPKQPPPRIRKNPQTTKLEATL
jgi:transposase